MAVSSLLTQTACVPRSKSELKNIYTVDEANDPRGNSRRHSASEAEAVWTVDSPCGTSILLDAFHLMTAAHCKPEVGQKSTSGLRMLSGKGEDLIVRKIIESSSELDYAIMEVEWLQPMPSEQKFPPFIAIDPNEVLTDENYGSNADFIFSVGFPIDKANVWPVTYAEGLARHIYNNTLLYDIGVINGNSGGGILKKDNNMLIGVVSKGNKVFDEAGWNKNDVSDPNSWNLLTPTWEIYKVSPVLQALYPKGKHHQLADFFVPRTRIYLGVQTTETESYLWASAGFEAASIVLCTPAFTTAAGTCKSSGSGVEQLVLKDQKKDRKFFRSAKSKTGLIDRKTYTLAAYDKSGQLLAKRRVSIKKKD